MTDKEKIKILRIRGYGFKAISKMLKCSRDAAKSYCARNNITPQTENIIPIENDLCLQCFEPLVHIPKHKQKRFCSDKCRRIWWYQHKKLKYGKECECKQCGNIFYKYPSENRKFCSRTCYFAYRYGGGKSDKEKLS